MLMYKQYNPAEKENPIKVPDTSIPEYLKSEVEEETVNLIKIQNDREEKLLSLKLKVWNGSDLKVLNLKSTDTLEDMAL